MSQLVIFFSMFRLYKNVNDLKALYKTINRSLQPIECIPTPAITRKPLTKLLINMVKMLTIVHYHTLQSPEKDPYNPLKNPSNPWKTLDKIRK
jgi:hypothetical protein